MQSTSPIRRYVIVRRRDHGASTSAWSMERLAPSTHGEPPAPAAAPSPAQQDARAA